MADLHPSPAKADLRARLRAARRERPRLQGEADATAIAGHALAWEPLRAAGTVAAYVSVGDEPGTGPLLEALHARGVRVLLPVVLPDLDLDWAPYAGEAAMTAAVRGLREPTTARLGPGAIRAAAVVVAPGLAVSPTGQRLGQGGGCYDRALARLAPGTPVAVLLHDDEVGLDLPVEPHDRPVSHAITPSGLRALTPPASA